MNKEAVVRSIKEKSGDLKLTLKDSKAVLDIVLDAIVDGLKTEGSVSLQGFGTFELVEKAESEKRNPKTQEIVKVPAHKALKVKMSKTLKASLR